MDVNWVSEILWVVHLQTCGWSTVVELPEPRPLFRGSVPLSEALFRGLEIHIQGLPILSQPPEQSPEQVQTTPLNFVDQGCPEIPLDKLSEDAQPPP